MELHKIYLFLIFFIFLSLEKISALNSTEKFQIVVPEKLTTQQKISLAHNKTIDKLVQEQTDLIKKIVSSHKPVRLEYPIVTKKEAEVKDVKIKEQKEQESIEDLQRKCQELLKLSVSNNTQKIGVRSETKEGNGGIKTVEAFGPNKKPEFLQKTNVQILQPELPPKFSHPSQAEQQMNNKYFILTRNRTTTNSSQTVTANNTQQTYSNIPITETSISQAHNIQQHPANIKYVQLEPVILQKMILNNGRTVFYWHKSIPVIPQFVSMPKYNSQVSDISSYPTFKYPSQNSNDQSYSSQVSYQAENSYSQTYPSQISYTSTYPAQNLNMQKSQISNIQSQISRPQPQTSNTESQVSNTRAQISNSQSKISNTQSEVSNTPSQFSYFPLQIANSPPLFPNSQKYPSQFAHNYESQALSTQTFKTQASHKSPTVSEQVPKYEIEYGKTQTPNENLYMKQLKFIIPMPYPNGDEAESGRQYPWQIDPYAYYPKPVQPNVINVPVPYVPTYHMIRTLRLPENVVGTNNGKNLRSN